MRSRISPGTRGKVVLLGTLIALLASPGLIQAVQILTIDTSQVSFNSPTATDFDAGYVEKLSANTLTVESDVAWKVQIKGTASTWSCTGVDCWSGKPRTDVEWRVSAGSYAGLTASPITVTTGSATTPGTEDVVLDYRVLLDWTQDAPGSYDYNDIEFTLSAL